jgi:2-keto-4-pentenoate hydratase/2-oxohepta-3-ene-1,7-dioic acid hydratase in catechol pathway
MKLVTHTADTGHRPGVLMGADILDLDQGAAILGVDQPMPTSLRTLLAGGQPPMDAVRRLLDDAYNADAAQLRAEGALLEMASTPLAPVIPDPGYILSVGMNYRAHLEEMNTPIPEKPAAFVKSPASLTGSGQPVLLPPGHDQMVDFEGELTFVMGRECHAVSEEDALTYVAGYTIANDVSARDWVAPIFSAEGNMAAIHAWETNVLGKNFPTFTPLGPVLVTRDEIQDPHQLHLSTTLNGEVVQDTLTELVFSIPRLIAHYSQWLRFNPGDVVTTGSPSGVGYGRDPKLFMKAGDVIEVSVGGIGTLSNPIKAQ